MDKKWYILKTRNTYERKVAERVSSYHTKDVYIKCLVPMEQVPDNTGGTMKFKDVLTYPGYVFIETNSLHGLLTEIKFIDGSQGFVKERDGRIATMSERDINRIYKIIDDNKINVDKYHINIGDTVNIKKGAFEGFQGKVSNIDSGIYIILVKLFNKDTEVRLSYDDLEKIN